MCENIHFDAYIQNNANFDGQEIIDKACDDMIFISHVRPQMIKKITVTNLIQVQK